MIRDENDEWTRFFLEELVLANTTIRHPLRTKYADYHYASGNALQERGDYEGARGHFRRGIKLSPLNVLLRDKYAVYLKSARRLQDYFEELNIIEGLNEEQKEIDDFKIKTRIELLQRELRGSLDHGLADSFTPKHRVNVYLVLKNRDLKSEFESPYFDTVLGKMLLDKLLESFLFKVEFLWEKEIKKVLGKDNQYNHYFLIHYRGQEDQATLELDFTLMNLSEELEKQFITSGGNRRYQRVLNQFKISMGEEILPQGEIVEVSSNRVTVSLGRLHGLKNGDAVRVFHDGRAVGEINVNKVGDYFSTASVLDYEFINAIKRGDVVQFVK